MTLSFKFCTPIYDLAAVQALMSALERQAAVRLTPLDPACLQVTLLASDAETQFLELVNACLLKAAQAHDS